MSINTLDPNAYSYGDAETDSEFEADRNSEPILIPEPISIPELFPEPILEPIPIPKTTSETDSGPTIWNRFRRKLHLTHQ